LTSKKKKERKRKRKKEKKKKRKKEKEKVVKNSLPARSGTPISISLSKRPKRRKAGSRALG
jgi:hypothetical protein